MHFIFNAHNIKMHAASVERVEWLQSILYKYSHKNAIIGRHRILFSCNFWKKKKLSHLHLLANKKSSFCISSAEKHWYFGQQG